MEQIYVFSICVSIAQLLLFYEKNVGRPTNNTDITNASTHVISPERNTLLDSQELQDCLQNPDWLTSSKDKTDQKILDLARTAKRCWALYAQALNESVKIEMNKLAFQTGQVSNMKPEPSWKRSSTTC